MPSIQQSTPFRRLAVGGCAIAILAGSCARGVDLPLQGRISDDAESPGSGGTPLTGSAGHDSGGNRAPAGADAGGGAGGGGTGGRTGGAGNGSMGAGGTVVTGAGGGGAGGRNTGAGGGSGGRSQTGSGGAPDAGPPRRPTGVTTSAQTNNSDLKTGDSPNGAIYSATCPTNQAVIGYRGTVDAAGSQSTYLRSLQATCGTFSISASAPYRVTVTQAGTIPLRGADSAVAVSAMCPANQIVVAFSGHAQGLIDAIAPSCAPLTISGASPYTLSIGSTTPLAPPMGGPGGLSFAAINCPDGQIAVGDTGRAQPSPAEIEAFGLICAAPALVVP